jgi:hypothetical protein
VSVNDLTTSVLNNLASAFNEAENGGNEFESSDIPLLEKEGWMRDPKEYREETLVRADGVVRPAKSLGLKISPN